MISLKRKFTELLKKKEPTKIGYYSELYPDRIYGPMDSDKPVTWHAYVNGNVTFIYVANREIDLIPKEGKRNWRYLGQIVFIKNGTEECKAISLKEIAKMYSKASAHPLPSPKRL